MYNLSINRLLETYDKILKVNLTSDTYDIIKYDESQESTYTKRTKSFSDWISLFAIEGNVYSEDIPTFKKYTSLLYLRQFFKENDNHWVQYRRRYADVYCWCEMLVMTAEDYSNENQQVYLFIKKMNEAKKLDINKSYFSINKKVLIVDDNDTDKNTLKEYLSPIYDVLLAGSKDEASRILINDYENIISIIGHLGKTQEELIDVIKLLRKNSRYDSIPVIVATPKYSSKLAIECLENGAFDVIVKPYNKTMIINKLSSISKLKYSMSMLNTLKKDPLTGLYTMPYFYKKVEETLQENPNKSYRMICTDIENFRLINENYGANIGDKVLSYIAENISTVMPNIIVGGRISGDIFAFLREDIPFKYDVDAWKAFRKNSPIPNLIVKYGLSTVDRSNTVQIMCDHARMAATSIKRIYDKPFAEYNEELQQQKMREKKIIDSMEDALLEKKFLVYYQPKHDLKTNEICGAEALVRWEHETLGFLSPGEFIPIFEKNGFIEKLDEYVREQVCEALKKWIDLGQRVMPISVNLSRRDFNNENLVSDIVELTSKYGISPNLIHFEITESIVTNNINKISKIIETLREKGFVIELDDFGAGYSSLTMLNDIDIDVLKIDKSILDMNLKDDKNKILEFCVMLSKTLDLKTVVEGVETQEQIDMLRELNCDYVQGYFYSKPLPLGEFEEYAKRN